MQEFANFMHNNWGWIVSFVSIIGGLVIYVYRYLKALQQGVQALLRAQMIQYYNYYKTQGYAPIYARESFENCWVQYERLGKNGVMKDIHEKFLALPTSNE